jgi:hypothetical protein
MIDANRLKVDCGILLKLEENEILDIENILYNLFGCSNK